MSAQTQPAATRREDAPLGVLVGVDGSDQSVSAARWAHTCAHRPLHLSCRYATSPLMSLYADTNTRLPASSLH